MFLLGPSLFTGCFSESDQEVAAVLDYLSLFACKRSTSGEYCQLKIPVYETDDDNNAPIVCEVDEQEKVDDVGCCAGDLMTAARTMANDGSNAWAAFALRFEDTVRQCNLRVPQPCGGSSSGTRSWSTPEIVGVVFGGVCVIVLIGGLVFFMTRSRGKGAEGGGRNNMVFHNAAAHDTEA